MAKGFSPNMVHGHHSKSEKSKTQLSEKLEKLKALVELRRSDRTLIPPNFNLADFHDGIYDRHDFVSPWSISAHNPNAKVMIFLQDWSSSDVLEKGLDSETLELGYTPHLTTNKNLLQMIDLYLGVPLSDLYITNLFVFVKPGRLSANIPVRHMTYSASRYGLAQIEIIRPKMVLCLGGATYNGMRRALGVNPVKIGAGLDMPPISYCEAKIYGLSHPGGLGVKNAGGMRSVHDQWKTIGKIHNSL